MWPQIIYFVVMLVVSYLMRPKIPPSPTQMPGEVTGPTVDASSPVPVLFGTRLMKSPNCVWYGAVASEPIVSCGGKK